MIRLSYLSPKTEVRESIEGGSASPKTMLAIAEGANIRRGSLHANALRTTRSTVAILCDEAALLSLAKNGSAREQDSRAWSICHGRHCQKRNRRRERRSHC